MTMLEFAFVPFVSCYPSTVRQPVHQQHGMVLLVTLLMLVFIALVGFSSMQGTLMQQHMAVNQYDREVSFQSAEAALKVAQNRMLATSRPASLIARDCSNSGVVCEGNPFNQVSDDSALKSSIIDVSSNQYKATDLAPGQPQYLIESMGQWADYSAGGGYDQSANGDQYGGSAGRGDTSKATYYRITARSGDPDKIGHRAMVTLQAMLKQN